MKPKKIYKNKKTTTRGEIKISVLREFVRKEWVITEKSRPNRFDDEDLARANLIIQLQNLFGVNDEGIPIILHLLDQLHGIRNEIRRLVDEEIVS